MKRWSSILSALALGVLLLPVGCHKDDGLKSEDKDKAARYADIIKKSGGDWDKISQADKDYITTTFANGDEKTAQIIVANTKAHQHPRATPGAGPPGGTPGQPPGGS
jgi:hypothetical protein